MCISAKAEMISQVNHSIWLEHSYHRKRDRKRGLYDRRLSLQIALTKNAGQSIVIRHCSAVLTGVRETKSIPFLA